MSVLIWRYEKSYTVNKLNDANEDTLICSVQITL